MPPFFDPEADDAGLWQIRTVIGHEISHGFDDSGRRDGIRDLHELVSRRR